MSGCAETCGCGEASMLRKVTDAECGRMISAAIDEACTSRSVGTISLEGEMMDMNEKNENAKNTNINATRFNTHNEAYEAYQREVLDAKVARGEAKKDTMHDLLENLHGFLKWLYEPPTDAKAGGENPASAFKPKAEDNRSVDKFTEGRRSDAWYGVELAALCDLEDCGNNGAIGKPVKEACDMMTRMFVSGKRIKVITKRILPVAGGSELGIPMAHITYYDLNALSDNPKPPDAILGHENTTVDLRVDIYIKMWCKKHLGFEPEIVSKYDKNMLEVLVYEKSENRDVWAHVAITDNEK